MAALEDYLELVAAVEATAEDLGLPVVLEGYEPPRDARLEVLRITPDPGVLEANVQPAHSWRELVENTTFLYEAARESRLSSEKFMLDGRHTGTGGGNHFVLGGATPARFTVPAPPGPAREPDRLLAQPPVAVVPVLGAVHRTDQPGAAHRRGAQRLGIRDRASRSESWKGRLPRARVAPWLVDRLLRNLLIDASGNTHRVGILHRQAVLARRPRRAARPARDARVRNAAARAHVPYPTAAAARARGALLAQALSAAAPQALGHRAARPVHAAATSYGRISRT